MPEKTKAAVATSEGPITVHRQVSDARSNGSWRSSCPSIPGVRKINVAVDDGVVTLEGRVDDDGTAATRSPTSSSGLKGCGWS